MRFDAFVLLAAVGFTAASPRPATTQVQVLERGPGYSRVRGTVVEAATGQSVADAEVVLLDTLDAVMAAVVTDRQGRFTLSPRHGGAFVLVVGRLGYADVRTPLRCLDGERLVLRVSLDVEAVELGGLDVTTRATPRSAELSVAGFESRRIQVPGFFVDEAEIAERRPTRLTDVVGRAPGASVLRLGGRVVDVRFLRGQGVTLKGAGPCLPSIWLDGVRVREGGRPEGDLRSATFPLLNDLIGPEQVAAIEVYASSASVPAPFRGTGSSCGVVVVWSRRE
ncbi:MAG: hypothetical protein AMXMBFR53_40530 [Gemmatimonadota bacterium]